MAQAAHTLKSHTNKDRQKEQQICASLLHSLQERRQLGGMTGSPTPLKVLFLSLLFVFCWASRAGAGWLRSRNLWYDKRYDFHKSEQWWALGARLTAKGPEGSCRNDGNTAYPDLGSGEMTETYWKFLKLSDYDWCIWQYVSYSSVKTKVESLHERRPPSIRPPDLRSTAKPLPMRVSWMEGGEETRKSRERRRRKEKCPLGRESTRHVELVFYEGTYKSDTFTIVKVTGSQARRLGWDYWLYLCKWRCPPKIHMLKPTPPMWWHLEVGLWEVIESWGWRLMNRMIALKKETSESALAPSAVGGYSKKLAIDEWGSRPSSHTKSAGTFIWGRVSLQNCEN